MQYRSKPPLQDVVSKPGRPPLEPTRPRQPTPAPRVVAPRTPAREPMLVVERPRETFETSFQPTQEKQSSSWLLMGTVIALVIIGSAVGLSLMFTGATVTVTPRTETSTVDTTFTAQREPQAGELGFSVLTLERNSIKQVKATSEAQVETRASGQLTITNDYSTEPVRLIKNTRFESADGKIFKVRESVVIPGMKEKGGAMVAGELTVTVYADQPGDEYNIAPGRFTVPGFEGRPQFKTVTAFSSAPFSGGFKGTQRTVDEATLQATRAELEQNLRAELREAALASPDVSEQHTLYGDALTFVFEPTPVKNVGDDALAVGLTGKVHGIVFNKADFAAYLAGQVVPGYDGTPVAIVNPDTLSVSVSAGGAGAVASGTPVLDEEAAETPAEQQTGEISLATVAVKGQVSFVWQFNEEKLRSELAGKEKLIMDMPPDQTVMGNYPGIKSARAVVRPFWRGSFPSKAEDITIVTLLDS